MYTLDSAPDPVNSEVPNPPDIFVNRKSSVVSKGLFANCPPKVPDTLLL